MPPSVTEAPESTSSSTEDGLSCTEWVAPPAAGDGPGELLPVVLVEPAIEAAERWKGEGRRRRYQRGIGIPLQE
jgi:hypothetical protein